MKAIALEKPPLDHIVKTIVERFNPRRIVMFGSYARGEEGPDSDVDLLVEMETEVRKPYREMAIHDLFLNRGWAMDVFVYTPDEVRRLRNSPGTPISLAEAEGRLLYERPEHGQRDAEPPVHKDPVDVRMTRHEIARMWIRRAEDDLLAIDNMRRASGVPWSHVCFHAQSSAERLLNAFLIAHGRQARNEEASREILDRCAEIDRGLADLHPECVLLSGRGIDFLYPGDSPEPQEKEALAMLAAAKCVYDRIMGSSSLWMPSC